MKLRVTFGPRILGRGFDAMKLVNVNITDNSKALLWFFGCYDVDSLLIMCVFIIFRYVLATE